MTDKRLVVLVGATGSGKTDLSIRLAKHYRAPILSTDSRQVYRGMPIGTAQPTNEQLKAIEHHFIATLDIQQDFNCGQYEVQALELLRQLFVRHDTVIAVGGSGLYVKALCEGMDDLPEADPELRRTLRQRLANEGLESLPQADESLREEMDRWLAEEGLGALAEKLRELDPEYYRIVDLNNPARVVRALEVCLQTGRPYSEQRTKPRRERNFRILKIGTDVPRAELYGRIDRRVDEMLAEGLEVEARRLYPYKHLNALQTVGYKELFAYFDGRCSRDEAVELIKRNTRRYAKRQLTWFRRDPEIFWTPPGDTDKIIAYIDGTL